MPILHTNNILLSICMPTYNRCEQIKRQLQDVLKQIENITDDVEILVSDNASTDGTSSVLREICSQHARVRLFIQPENIGMEANFLFLATHAKGKFYWCIGDDDIIRPGTVGFVVNVLKKYNNIGGVILKCGGAFPSFDGKHFKWKKANFNITDECLISYSPQVLGKYPNAFGDTDWMFITKCIILRDAYVRIASHHGFIGNNAIPLFATCLSIHNKNFYYANKCGYINGVQDGRLDNWHYRAFEVCKDIISGIKKLADFDFSLEEINYLYVSEEAHIYYINTLGCIEHKMSIQETIDSNLDLQRRLGIPISEKRFWEKLSMKDPKHVIFLAREIINIGYYDGEIISYLKIRKEMKKHGYMPSKIQELKWIIKYIIIIKYILK